MLVWRLPICSTCILNQSAVGAARVESPIAGSLHFNNHTHSANNYLSSQKKPKNAYFHGFKASETILREGSTARLRKYRKLSRPLQRISNEDCKSRMGCNAKQIETIWKWSILISLTLTHSLTTRRTLALVRRTEPHLRYQRSCINQVDKVIYKKWV